MEQKLEPKFLAEQSISLQEAVEEASFWYYIFSRNNWKEEAGGQLRAYISEKYDLNATWLEKFTSDESEKALHTLCLNQGMNAELTISIKSEEAYEINLKYKRNKWHIPEQYLRLEHYKKITKNMPLEEKMLYLQVLKAMPQQKEEIKKLVKSYLEVTPFQPEDYDFIAKQIAACCVLSEEEYRKVLKESIKACILCFAAFVMLTAFLICNGMVSSYEMIGFEGVKRTFCESLASVLIGFMLVGCLIHWLFTYCRGKKRKKEKPRKLLVVLASFFSVMFAFMAAREVVTGIGAYKDMRNHATIEKESVESEMEMPMTWDGLEAMTLENPAVYLHMQNDVPTGYYLCADNTDLRFDLGDCESAKVAIEARINENLTVYYYQHSHVIERICIGNEVLVDENLIKDKEE